MIRFINTGISIISLLILNCAWSNAQSLKELNELKRGPVINRETVYIKSARHYNSEYEWAFGKLFIFYKKFVSSQDASSCSFTPSCSEYALLAIKKEGFLEGTINFWDRFSRCNGLSPGNYPVDNIHKVLIDPVRDWRYNEK
jgi:uncharacterized protein